ncbi:MAG: phosphate/phosphite/phosphonate ABC transporter substrate-binding protein [Anaerolineaceae bacterium]|nr:phosphate/phosphite/phosphonate ABC transporter substrate-binding protein [Anaerolineaceae bacterium]
MRNKALLLVILVAMLVVSVPMTMAQSDVGTPDNPIQVYFVPSVEASIIVSGGDVMKAALEAATGLSFEVSVPTSYAATIEAMCASPTNSMGFIPAAGYVVASDRCGVEVGAAAVRFGWSVYWAEYIVRRDSPIYTFGDLAGKTWGYGDVTSTSGYIVPATELANAGIEVGDVVETGGHNQTVLAVYNGEVDFGTTFYSPPLMPEGHASWRVGDLSEPWDLTVDESYVSDDGSKLFVGDIRVMDARANVRDTAPDIIDQVRVLRVSQPIPNDTLSFGPDFPEELRTQIIDALIAFSGTEEWASSIGSSDFYGWTSIAPAADADFDIVRDMVNNTPSLIDRYK